MKRKRECDIIQVITQPIDMETIESKIKGERYNTEEELISDFKLMFHNCQRYNEEGSVIHTDATTLERVRPGTGDEGVKVVCSTIMQRWLHWRL